MRTAPAVAALLASRAGHAQPPKEPTAADVAHAPAPGLESGRIDAQPGVSPARVLGRELLYVPKLVYEALLAPLRGVLWLDDHFELERLYDRIFFNRDKTIGLYPTASYETGFGASIGARFSSINVFGKHEHVSLEATTGLITGEPYREAVLGSLGTGDRLGRVALAVDVSFERRPSDPFDGIGNGDLVPPPGTPIDPLTNDTAVATHYRYQEARGALGVEVRALADLHLTATGALTALRVSRSTSGPPIDVVYAPQGLVGFDETVRSGYAELDVRWDSRRRVSPWETRFVYAAGTLADVYAGRLFRLDGGVDFWHYGLELQHAWHLARGPRVLVARLRGDAVSGARDEVPITELPMLGGGAFLRGYDYGRFRDRVAAVGSLQYEWDVSHMIEAYAFTDAGRVYPALDELTLRGLRVGFGAGLVIHSDANFLVDVALASSIDGGLFASASFSPVFDARPRWR